MADPEVYRVLMDERWALGDLYAFPRAYSLVHDFIYCFDSSQYPRDPRRINRALENYPWQGGYSYLNIYTVLRYQIPPRDRPEIAAIRYSSPGWMDLLLQGEVAIRIAISVATLLAAGVGGVEMIKRIDQARLEMARRRSAQRAERAELTLSEITSLIAMSEALAKAIGFGSLEALQERTKDPELTLKLLSAHYRRLQELADYVQTGKVALPPELPRDL